MKFDQDLCLNLKYDFGKMNSTLGSVVPLAMFYLSQVGDKTRQPESYAAVSLQLYHSQWFDHNNNRIHDNRTNDGAELGH